jgi:leucyl aminopeptidase (aminopeptidase T)
VDGAVAGVGLPAAPIVMMVEDGRIVSIEGGADAEKLRGLLESADENAFRIAELGIGTNPSAKLMGHPLVDEKVLGTVHIGLGNNLFMGGAQDSATHLDVIMLQPQLLLDTEVVLDGGKIIA